MYKIAQLQIPGFPDKIYPDPGVKSDFLKDPSSGGGLGYFVSSLYEVAILMAGALVLIWMVWGIFEYIFASGNKEALAKARSRIAWALLGFLIIMVALFVSQWAESIFDLNTGFKNFNTVTPITEPPPP